MGFSLLEVLPEKDKELFKKYVLTYGNDGDKIDEKLFVGVDEYLKYWGVNKIKLYKLLGKQLQYRVPFEYKKSEDELKKEMRNLVDKNPFCIKYYTFFCPKVFDKLAELEVEVTHNERREVYDIADYVQQLILNETNFSWKVKPRGCKTTLQIAKGTKIMKAIQKILNYFSFVFENENDKTTYNLLLDKFEEFRIKHSMILNDKIIKKDLVFSVHPMDFVTMSDNNSDWQSCMSWVHEGCYHEGTVEMMNSNNVICCYLESNRPYYFVEDDKSTEWNNKLWRCLVYLEKDIIVTGKSYPYYNKELNMAILNTLRKLAKQNLGWTYEYGPQPYNDMTMIWSIYRMENNRAWIKYNQSKKYNILFDSKGMYNDMLNDNDYPYYCIRNKPKKAKIISYSGPAKCLCCNGDLVKKVTYDVNYNDKYEGSAHTVCKNCRKEHRCDECGNLFSEENLCTTVESRTHVCKKCLEKYYYKCPDCGKLFRIETYKFGSGMIYVPVGKPFLTDEKYNKVTERYNTQVAEAMSYDGKWTTDEVNPNKLGICLQICNKCKRDIGRGKIQHPLFKPISTDWGGFVVSKKPFYPLDMDDPAWDEMRKYLIPNLEKAKFLK